MLSDRININYNGFNPSEETKMFVESIVHEIKTELPGGAKIKAQFTKKNEIIKGVLQVGSNAGAFFSVAAADNLKVVTDQLTNQMRRRIDKWKSRRHSRENINNSFKTDLDNLDIA